MSNPKPPPTFVTAEQLLAELNWIVRRMVKVEASRLGAPGGMPYPEATIAAEWQKETTPQIVGAILASIS